MSYFECLLYTYVSLNYSEKQNSFCNELPIIYAIDINRNEEKNFYTIDEVDLVAILNMNVLTIWFLTLLGHVTRTGSCNFKESFILKVWYLEIRNLDKILMRNEHFWCHIRKPQNFLLKYANFNKRVDLRRLIFL